MLAVSHPGSELRLDYNQVWTRNPFNFWEPLNTYFLLTMQKLANYSQMQFMAPFYDFYYRTALPYDSPPESVAHPVILMENHQAGLAIERAAFTSTGVDFYHAIVLAPDTIPPLSHQPDRIFDSYHHSNCDLERLD